MTIAIIGSRSLDIPIPDGLIPDGTAKIISGGAKGMDFRAREYALSHRILIEEIVPAYDLYGRRAPLIRNDLIISMADKVFVFWDGKSRGTKYIIKKCKETNKPYVLYIYDGKDFSVLEQYPAE